MGSNFGLTIGGFGQNFSQSFNSARQRAIEEAHIKMQDQQNQMRDKLLREAQDYKYAENIGAHPETAESMGHLYPEMGKYHDNPEGYSWTQPSVPATPPQPVAGPPEPASPGSSEPMNGQWTLPPMPGTPQQDFDPQTGRAGFESMMGYYGKQAADAHVAAQRLKYEQAMAMLGMKPANNPELAAAMAAARAAGGVIGKNTVLPQITENAQAQAEGTQAAGLEYAGPKANATGVATGKVQPGGGTTTIPGPNGAVQVPVGIKTPGPTQVKEMADLDQAISFTEGIGKTAASGAPGTESGKPIAWWTGLAKQYQSTPIIGDAIKMVDPNLPTRAAYHAALNQNMLSALRTQFKGRISNFDILFGKDVIPNADDSDEVVKAKINEQHARLVAMRTALNEANKSGGVGSMQPIVVDIPPGGFLGQVGPANGPQPTGQVQMPGQAPYNLGVSPVPAPGNGSRLRTLQIEQ
jgi:hypothetical protein